MEYPIGVTIEEGQALLLQAAPPPAEEWVDGAHAAGRVLARDITAPESIPPFARSPYDGYALRAADTAGACRERPVTLTITEEVAAGQWPACPVGPGQAAKILTGAPIPEGADLVVPFEETQFTPQQVTLFREHQTGGNIVPAGEDVAAGDRVARAGTVVSPALAGLLAGLGCTRAAVYRRVRVALFSTGSELVEPGEPLTPGKIRNSSAYTLKAYLEQLGAEVCLLPIAGDDVEEIAGRIREGAAVAELVLTTGGVSVGDYDLLGRAVEHLGGEILFWKVQMKPGSAFLASRWQGTPVVSLSGNPAAAAVAFFLLAVPLLRRLGGRTDCLPEVIQVRLAEGFPKGSPNRRLVPGRLVIADGMACLSLYPRQANGMLSHLQDCDLLGEIPAGSPPLPAGSVITAYRVL